jgi:hypothetical protein
MVNESSLGFDTSMNQYTIDDLLGLLDLGSNPSQSEIVNKITVLSNMFTVSTDEPINKSAEEIQEFFSAILERLLDNFSNNTSMNAEGANYFDYNIENPLMSQLPLAAPNFEDITDINPEELLQCYDITQEEIDILNQGNRGDMDPIEILERDKGEKTSLNYEFTYSNATVNSNRTLFKFSLPTTLTNITDLQLANITVPLPYTFSDYKNNNKFYIIDVSNIKHLVSIPSNIHYLHNSTNLNMLVEKLNAGFILNHTSSILHYMSVIIDHGTTNQTLSFDLSVNSTFSTFTLDFNVPDNLCGLNYSLADRLGFNQNLYTDISHVKGQNYVKYDIGKLYFSLNDYTANYTQQYVVPSNIYNKNILASFNMAFNSASTNTFSKDFTTSLVSRPIRIYNGYINLLNFEVQFFDNKGNVQQLPLEYLNDNNFNFQLAISREV